MNKIGKLLIVEDDVSLTKYMQEHLEAYFEVEIAYDGQEGYEKAIEFNPDCILSDVRMPRLSGISMIKKIRRTPGLEIVGIVLLSVLGEKKDRIIAYENLADLYFTKPFDMEVLLPAIIGLVKLRHQMKTIYQNEKAVPDIPLGKGLDNDDQQFLFRVNKAIEHRLGVYDLKVDTIAGAIHVSKRQLERKLKELEGITPSVYIRQVRLEEAKKIIATGTVSSVLDLGCRVGYKDTKTFAKHFQAHFGYSASSIM